MLVEYVHIHVKLDNRYVVQYNGDEMEMKE